MGQSERSLTALGRRVADLQDRMPAARLDRERGRARLLEAARLRDGARGPGAAPPGRPRREGTESGARLRAPGKRRAARLAASLAAAAVLLAVVAAVFVARPRAPMRFELGASGPGVVGAWIAAPAAAALPIRFSDGTQLRLAPGGRARITSVTAHGAEISLERGALDLSVVHRERARWRVLVGPFQIDVIGTRFETRWDPATEQLVLALREGAITVSGPVVGDARAVRAGERLTVSPATNTVVVDALDEASTSTRIAPSATAPSMTAPSATAPSMTAPSATVPSMTAPSAAAPSATARAPDAGAASVGEPADAADLAALGLVPRDTRQWQTLALEGRYRDALAAAEREGFDAICGAAGASELHALGDAARLGGSPARAAQAFAALRARFPGSPEAASAAFMLGRIAQDHRKDHAAAAAWFTRYLSEQPAGAFAADAAGRLVEAEDRRGDEAAARRAAERYLAAHPNGAHAAYAKHLLARGSKPAAHGSSPGMPGPAPEPQAP
ncbi:FecR domain-containing protein [Sorangium sp. So ce1036]|uniref:FecR domain-containing protein n=1 Tax=Sorangium sp. So ce1036 TaxID=3133328 RepID=UPI003F0321B9